MKHIFLVFKILTNAFAFGQSDSLLRVDGKQPNIHSIGTGIQHGFIFAHSKEVQNTKGSHPTGAELIVSWQRSDAAVWSICNCLPRKGILLSYYDYDNAILGKSITAAYFLEPTYRLSRNTYFSFKGSAGLSYLTDPFDSISNPTNKSYSTNLSAYLQVGIGLWLKLSDRWWINASMNYNHESNGGMKQPNKGINWPTGGLLVNYMLDPRPFYRGHFTKEKYWLKYPVRWELAIFGMARRALESGNSSRFPLIGIMLLAGKQVGRINALTLSTEIYYDEKLRLLLKADSLDASATKAGLMIGHEFILGRFLFSQRLGFYYFDQTPYFDQLYHRWGIQYNFRNRFGIGFNMKAHRQVAEFVDLRFSYVLNNRSTMKFIY